MALAESRGKDEIDTGELLSFPGGGGAYHRAREKFGRRSLAGPHEQGRACDALHRHQRLRQAVALRRKPREKQHGRAPGAIGGGSRRHCKRPFGKG